MSRDWERIFVKLAFYYYGILHNIIIILKLSKTYNKHFYNLLTKTQFQLTWRCGMLIEALL